MEISVVIPTINEEDNISQLLPRIKNVLAELVRSYEIIVVDGGSRDKTVKVAKDKGAKVVRQRTRGLGLALRRGFKVARGRYLVTMDGDLSHEPEYLIRLWKNRRRAELVIASRYTINGSYSTSFFRALLSIILNRMFSFVLAVPIKDLSSGFRLYKKRVLDNIKLDSRDFEIEFEIALKILSEGYRIFEVPFHYKQRRRGCSHVRLYRFAISYIKSLVKLWQLRRMPGFSDYDASAFYSRMPFQRWWQRKTHDTVLTYLEERDSILDIGCGSGKIIIDLPQATGVDINLFKLLYLKETNGKLVNADATHLPFKDESFSNIICNEVIEHIPGQKVFNEFKRLLRPGGTLIIGTPDYTKPIWNILEKIYKFIQRGGYADEHINHYSLSHLKKTMLEHGFKIVSYKYLFWSVIIMKAHKHIES